MPPSRKAMDHVKLLHIDDDETTRVLVARILGHFGNLTLIGATNAEEGLDTFIIHRPDIVITDLVMPRHNGIWLAEQIRKVSKDTMIVIMSAYCESEDLYNTPGIVCVPKPVDYNHLKSIIVNLMQHVKLSKEFKALVKVIVKCNIV